MPLFKFFMNIKLIRFLILSKALTCGTFLIAEEERTEWSCAEQLIRDAQSKLIEFQNKDPKTARQDLRAWAKNQSQDLLKKKYAILNELKTQKGLTSSLDINDLELLKNCLNVAKAIQDDPLVWENQLKRIQQKAQQEHAQHQIEKQATEAKVAEVKSVAREILAIELFLIVILFPLGVAVGLI